MSVAHMKDTCDSSFTPHDITCQRFTLSDILSATNNFDEALVIGHGGFGKVYRCTTKILSLKHVALKRLSSISNQGASEFEAEVKVLSKLRHANLVSLIGYCLEGKEMVLAYEFMPNGTLQDHLGKADSTLSWLQRLKICIGAARGLDYLHTGTSTQHEVIHRDMKTSNILLDASFAAKISDFGLAKVTELNQEQTYVSTLVKGTFGYMDPSYVYNGKLTKKSDVYAFGVVLFEVLTGKRAVDSTLDEEQWCLAVWAQDQIKAGKLNQIFDYNLMGHISTKCLKEFANIAIQCLDNQPKQRPTMSEVVVKLESILSQERERANYGVDERRFTNKLHLKPEEFNHPNLVKLLGYCLNEQKLYCVYELTPDTSLNKLLFGGAASLSWVARLKIALGTARGLSFLHLRNHPAYNQFMSNCILVDMDYNARLSDFEVVGSVASTGLTYRPYVAPEWFRYKADKFDGLFPSLPIDAMEVRSEIYSFGVILLEILTGMKAYDKNRPYGKQNLVKWATPLLADKVNLGIVMDPRLQDYNYRPSNEAFKLALLVSKCLQPCKEDRPSMEEIIKVLCECCQQEKEKQ